MDNATRPILFVSMPEAGLYNALFMLAGELAQRGVPDIWFATDEPRRGEIEAMSVSFASLGEVIPELSALTWDDETYRAVTQPGFRGHRALLRQAYRPDLALTKYRQLEAVVDKVNPALMIIDCETRFASNLAIARQIPYVLSVPFLISNAVTQYTPFGRSYAARSFPTPHTGLPYKMNLVQQLRNRWFRCRALGMFLNPAMGKVLRQDIAISKELGLPRPDPMTKVDQAELVLCYSVPEVDYPVRIPGNVRMVGTMIPPLPESDDRELTGWLDERPSVIYVGLGTNSRLTRAEISSLVEVARRLDGAHHVLWKLSRAQQQLLPPPDSLPGNLRIENWVPSQLDVLAHPNVTAFVAHGGSGVIEGLHFGKPMVVRPLWADCYDLAMRVRDKGVGLPLDPRRTADPDHVTHLLTRVLQEPSFRRQSAQFAGLLQAAGGRDAAADLVLGLPTLA